MTWGDKAVLYIVIINLMHITETSWWWLIAIVFLHIFLDEMEDEYAEDNRKTILKKHEPSEN